MAGLKTLPKKKRDSSKPSTVLVVFLVFFILLSIGLGVWGYYGYAGQEKLETAAKTAANSAKAEKEFANYMLYISNEARLAIGPPGNAKDAVILTDDAPYFDETRKKVLSENFKADKYTEPFKELLKALKSDLGEFDEAAKRYPISYRDLVAKLKADLKSSNAQLASPNDELKTG